MIKECKNCADFNGKSCNKNYSNPVNKCHKYKTIPIEILENERNKLLVSKSNPKRLK